MIFWRGNAGQEAHDFVLQKLQTHAASFIGSAAEMSEPRKGNLAEFITAWVGQIEAFVGFHLCQPANAHQPLNAVSRQGLDLLWLQFGESPGQDLAVVQEVKATGSPGLAYASSLPPDYQKLFGTNPNLTLQTRLAVAKSELEFGGASPDLIHRVTLLAGATAATSPNIQLVPTLVHDDMAPSPEVRLQAVRAAIAGQGWPSSQITPWSIALDALEDRLLRLAMGRR